MVRRRRAKATRGVLVSVVILIGAVIGLLVLIVFARQQTHSPEASRVTAILMEAQQRVISTKNALAEARKQLPPDGLLPPDWNCLPALALGAGYPNQTLRIIAKAYLETPEQLPQKILDDIRVQLALLRDTKRLTPVLEAIDPENTPPESVLAHFKEYLCTAPELAQIEAGVTCGLCAMVTRPTEAIKDIPLLLSARAIAEGQAGDMSKGFDTCLCLYRLADLLGQSQSIEITSMRTQMNADTDNAVWRLADMAPVPEADRERLLTEIDKRLSATCLADACRLMAARMESGQAWERPQPNNLIDMFFQGSWGRGSMRMADRLLPLIEQPPYKVAGPLKEFQEFARQSRAGQPFLYKAISAYQAYWMDVVHANAMHVGFALKAWKRDHGSYPPALEALESEPRTQELREPATGNPIAYETSPEGGCRLSMQTQFDLRNGTRHHPPPPKDSANTELTVTNNVVIWESKN